MHEIITLQLGSRSNFLGTHFWNAQESYFTYSEQEESLVDHNVHFRPGIAADGSDTFTPRVLIYDFKQEFGSLRKLNELYQVLGDEHSSSQVWQGKTTKQVIPHTAPNEYQSNLSQGLDLPRLTTDDVRYWSDFNKVFYHPKSIVQIYDAQVPSGCRSFEDWQAGEELFAALNKEHDLLDDDLRPFLEECDQIQAIQLVTSSDDGWAGFAAKYLEKLRDESSKGMIWTWALEGSNELNQSKRITTTCNQARALFELSTQSSLYAPLAGHPRVPTSHLAVDFNSPWHAAAMQATLYETATLPSRLRSTTSNNAASLGSMTTTLNNEGRRNIAHLGLSVLDAAQGQMTNEADITLDCDMLSNRVKMTPERETIEYGRVDMLRGASYTAADTSRREKGWEVEMQRYQSDLGLPMLDSFPQIYHVGRQSQHLAARTSVATTSAVGRWIRCVALESRRHIAVEEREELSNGLEEMAEPYEDGIRQEDDDWDE